MRPRAETSLDWLDDLPEDWTERAIGREVWVRARLGWRGLTADEYVDDGIPMLATPNIKNAAIDYAGANKISPERYAESPEIMLQPGDVLLTKDGATIGTVNVVRALPAPATVNGSIAVLTPTGDLVGRYLYWFIASSYAQAMFDRLRGGMGVPHLFQGDINRIRFPFPPASEQQVIADYLDSEAEKLDELIAEQERLIDLLRERRLAVASDVVGSRIGTGERLKWLLTEIDVRAGERASYLPLMSVSISWGVRRRDDAEAKARAEDFSNYKVCRAGDLVINRMRAFQGALGLAPDEGMVSPDYAVLAIHDSVDAEWLAGAMKTADFVAQMAMRVKGIGSADLGNARTPRISVSDVGEIRVDVPARNLQRDEARNVRAQTTRIDWLIAESERFIELARERRSALVTAAVTGQIDVRSGAA